MPSQPRKRYTMRLLRLRTTRLVVAAALLAAALLGTGLGLGGFPLWAALACSASIGIATLTIGLLFVHLGQRISSRLRSIELATARSNDVAGSVGRMAPVVRRLNQQSQLSEERAAERHAETLEELRRLFQPSLALDPGVVSATAARHTLSSAAGRIGASVADDPESDSKLKRLLDTPPDERLPVVAAVASEQLHEALEGEALVHPLLPGLRSARTISGASYLVIEERALDMGVWSGATSTAALALFEQLSAAVADARRRSAVTVWISGGGSVGPLSAGLAQACEIVMHSESEAATSYDTTPVLAKMADYAVGRSRG